MLCFVSSLLLSKKKKKVLFLNSPSPMLWASQVAQWYRICLPKQEMPETQVQPLSQKDPLEEEMATRSSILAWEIPWTEEPGGLQPMRSQRVRHNRGCTQSYMLWVEFYPRCIGENSLVVQWLRLFDSTAGGTGSISGGRTKIIILCWSFKPSVSEYDLI